MGAIYLRRHFAKTQIDLPKTKTLNQRRLPRYYQTELPNPKDRLLPVRKGQPLSSLSLSNPPGRGSTQIKGENAESK